MARAGEAEVDGERRREGGEKTANAPLLRDLMRPARLAASSIAEEGEAVLVLRATLRFAFLPLSLLVLRDALWRVLPSGSDVVWRRRRMRSSRPRPFLCPT